MDSEVKNLQYYKFSVYGFLKNLRFFDAFFIIFLVNKGLSYTEIGILYAVREVCINVFEVPSGFIADTYGRINALVISFITYIISFIIFFFSSSFLYFLPAFILYGVGDAFRSGAHKGIIMDYLRKNNLQDLKITYYGHTRSWSQKGSAISALFAGFIVFWGGNYNYVFLFSIIPYLLNTALILSYPKDINLPSESKKGSNNLSIISTFKSFWDIIKQPKVLALINSSAVHSAYLKAVKDYIQLVMVQIALIIPLSFAVTSEKREGIVIGVLYFLIYLLTSWASRISAKAAERRGKAIAFITLLVGFASGITAGIFYQLNFAIIAFAAFVAIYLIENLRKPILTGYVADNVPNEILTSVISAQSLLKTLLTITLSFIFGIVADLAGIGISLIVTSSILILFSSVLEYFYRNSFNHK